MAEEREEKEGNHTFFVTNNDTDEAETNGFCAIVTYQSVPKECVVKVVNKSGDEDGSKDT